MNIVLMSNRERRYGRCTDVESQDNPSTCWWSLSERTRFTPRRVVVFSSMIQVRVPGALVECRLLVGWQQSCSSRQGCATRAMDCTSTGVPDTIMRPVHFTWIIVGNSENTFIQSQYSRSGSRITWRVFVRFYNRALFLFKITMLLTNITTEL